MTTEVSGMSLAAEPTGEPAAGPVAEPRWLDADEQKAWRAWLYSSLLLQDRLDRELTHQTGISHAYYEILVALSETPGRMSALSETVTRGACSATASTACLMTAMTSSHSPSTVVNMASVRLGSPEARTTRTASATRSPTESPAPSGVTEKATSMPPS